MQNSIFNAGSLVPGLPIFHLPVMNPAWMELYHPTMSANIESRQPTTQKKKGFSIADILSEENPTDNEINAMRRAASHPYYPAIHRTLTHTVTDRPVMRQCRNKRVRTIFTPEQLEQLEKIFEKQQYMVGTERYYLATKLHLSEAQVKVWFQNRRIKWRKQTGLEAGHHGTDMEEFETRVNTRYDYSDTCSESGFSDAGSL